MASPNETPLDADTARLPPTRKGLRMATTTEPPRRCSTARWTS